MMDRDKIYSKTGKGLTEVINGCASLSPEYARVLSMVDGAHSVATMLDSGHYSAVRLLASSDPMATLRSAVSQAP